jgi:thioredoxin-dependent peroxiredoxin
LIQNTIVLSKVQKNLFHIILVPLVSPHLTRAIITYPASTGRNFDEILRVIDSLQLTEHHKVATPGNWKSGEDVVIVPALQDPDEIAKRFPKGYKVVKPYLRLTPDPRF